MNIVAAVFADFTETFLGHPSRLSVPLGSRTVLGHTLSRLGRIDGVSQRCLVVQPPHADAARAAIAAAGLRTPIELLALDDGRRPRRALFRSARKWNLASWRGGALGTTWFDEFVEPLAVARVLDHYHCDAVLCLDGHQAALAPQLAERMLAHQRAHSADARFTFTAAPPGLAGVILGREVTRELLERNVPAGLLFTYRPETPQGDPLNRPACCQIDAGVAQTETRFIADTADSLALLDAAFGDLGADADAAALCSWFRSGGHDRAARLPLEIELELTTADPLPNTALRPRGRRVPKRELADLDAFRRLCDDIAVLDDRLAVLGGHGDPLQHARFTDVCRVIRSAGICGLAVVSPVVDLTADIFEALFAHHVDILEVQLDAHTPETYRAVHHADHFDRVLANIERVERARRDRLSPQPLVVCSLTRCTATQAELELFYDHWIRRTGNAVIRGYNDHAGLLPADDLLAMTPSVRIPCRRLATRLTLLADGSVPFCSQDVTGATSVADWRRERVTDIWRNAKLNALRDVHSNERWREFVLCESCREWSRP